MRILTTGSRDWEGYAPERHIQRILTAALNLAEALDSPLTVVHGACPTGADQCVDRWALRREGQVILETHPANWQQYGKGAGPRRNKWMVDLGADLCIGFLRAGSTGTTHCMTLARYNKIPTFRVDWNDSWATSGQVVDLQKKIQKEMKGVA